ncbi:MAG: lysophospholipid acyltransferase family protein [Bdellovibrionota bacterium]
MEHQPNKLRGLVRLTAFLGITLFFVLRNFVTSLFLKSCPHRCSRLAQEWARILIRGLGVRLEVWGSPPEGTALLVSNHRSYIDIAAILSQVPSTFLAKAEVADWPVVGRAARVNNTVFVQREDRDSRRQARLGAQDHLTQGLTFTAFPEGTTARAPEVLPFSPGLFEVAHKNQFPVCPVAIEYGDPEDAWVGDESFFGHFLRCLGKRTVHIRLAFGPVLGERSAQELREFSERWIRSNLRAPVLEWEAGSAPALPKLSAA